MERTSVTRRRASSMLALMEAYLSSKDMAPAGREAAPAVAAAPAVGVGVDVISIPTLSIAIVSLEAGCYLDRGDGFQYAEEDTVNGR